MPLYKEGKTVLLPLRALESRHERVKLNNRILARKDHYIEEVKTLYQLNLHLQKYAKYQTFFGLFRLTFSLD